MKGIYRSVLTGLLALAIEAGVVSKANAQDPSYIRFAGELTDVSGLPVDSGLNVASYVDPAGTPDDPKDDVAVGEGKTLINGGKTYFTNNTWFDDPMTPELDGAKYGDEVHFILIKKDGTRHPVYLDKDKTDSTYTMDNQLSVYMNLYADQNDTINDTVTSTTVPVYSKPDVTLFPNPIKGYATIRVSEQGCKDASVRVVDVGTGRVQDVYRGRVCGGDEIRIDGNGMPHGNIIINYIEGDRQKSMKAINLTE